MHILANVLLVWEGIKDGFFYAELNSSQKFLKQLREAESKCARYNLPDTSIQYKFLNFELIEKRKSCAHLCKSFAEWCRATETNIMAAARTDFMDELL